MIVYSNSEEVVVLEDDSYQTEYPHKNFENYIRYDISGAFVVDCTMSVDFLGKLFMQQSEMVSG